MLSLIASLCTGLVERIRGSAQPGATADPKPPQGPPELPGPIQARAIAVMVLYFEGCPEVGRWVREAMKQDGNLWWADIHFTMGMQWRNVLRGTIPDKDLPSGNWDDYYIRVVEDAAVLYWDESA